MRRVSPRGQIFTRDMGELKRFLANIKKNLPKEKYVEKAGVDFCCGIGLLQRKPNSRAEDMKFPGVSNCQRYTMYNFQGLIKNEVEFPRMAKKK